MRRVKSVAGREDGARMPTRREFRDHAHEQRRLQFVEVRKRGGGDQERARRRRQMGQTS